MTKANTGFPDEGHNHHHCIKSALEEAEALCISRGAQLTPLRRRVLELVWESHQPRGAYDILQALSAEKRSGAVAPPTVYRALDFLQAQGLVHRIESLNAFVGCPHPKTGDHASQFLICQRCGTAVELQDEALSAALHRSAEARDFLLSHQTVELHGLCPDCQAIGNA